MEFLEIEFHDCDWQLLFLDIVFGEKLNILIRVTKMKFSRISFFREMYVV